MHNLLRLIFIILLICITAVIINPGLAPGFIPKIYSRYEVDGWIFFSHDKVGHFFLIGLAALVLNFLLQAKRVKVFKMPFLLGSIIVAVLVTIEELRQVPLTDRSFEMLDMFYNFAGIFVFGRVGAWLARQFSSK
ncbi:MAG: hypothetical protein ACI8YQ_003752 [Polaribacter sp.]|jgi:hypothetical protein